MCQHNKAGVVASWRRDKVGDIECLVPDLASGDLLSLWGTAARRREKKIICGWRSARVGSVAKSTRRETDDRNEMKRKER